MSAPSRWDVKRKRSVPTYHPEIRHDKDNKK